MTEAHAGSDPVRDRDDGRAAAGRRLADPRREVVRDERRRGRRDHRRRASRPEGPTLFAVPTDAPRDHASSTIPPYTHAYPHGHPTLRLRRRGRPGRGARAARRRRRPAARVVHRGAARDRGARDRRDGAAAERDAGVGDRARAGRRPALGPPGRLVPARRLGRRRGRGPAARARGRAARRRGRRPQGRARQGVDGEAVRQRGRVPLRRPRGAGVRRPRLPPRQRRRAACCASCASTASGRARARSSG